MRSTRLHVDQQRTALRPGNGFGQRGDSGCGEYRGERQLREPEDPAALADALEKVVVDPHYRYNLARAGWDKAKKVYSLQRVISQLKKVYTEVKAKPLPN